MFVAAENAEATFIPKYHKGVWINGSYTCCNQISKNAIGCEVTSTERGEIYRIFFWGTKLIYCNILYCQAGHGFSKLFMSYPLLSCKLFKFTPLFFIYELWPIWLPLCFEQWLGVSSNPPLRPSFSNISDSPNHSHKFLDLCVRTKIMHWLVIQYPWSQPQSYHIMKSQWK